MLHMQSASVCPRVALSLHNHASVLVDLDRLPEAESQVEEALRIFRQALPLDHWRIANTQSLQGAILSARGHFEEAEELLLESFAGVREKIGARSIYARKILKRLVALYESWDRPDQAAEFRERSRAGRTK